MLFGLATSRRALVSDMSTTQNRPLTWTSPKWASDNRRYGRLGREPLLGLTRSELVDLGVANDLDKTFLDGDPPA